MKRRTLLAAATACAFPLPLRAQTAAEIVVGGTATDDATPVLYALQSGIFKKYGLTVSLQKSPSGAAGVAAVVGGTYHFTGTNTLTVAAGHLKGVPIELAAPGGLYNGTSEFVATLVKASSPLQTAKDLNGKTLGVPSVGDLNTVSLFAWMDTNGGDSKTLKVVEMNYPLAIPGLEEDRIDVATFIQPFLGAALQTGKLRLFAKSYDAISTHFILSAWTTNSTWAAANPDVVRRFATAMRESEVYCNAHKAETAPLLAAFSGVDVAGILKGGRDTYGASYLNTKDLQPIVDAAFKYKALASRFDATEMISPALKGLMNT